MKKSVLASIAFCLMAVTGFAQQIPFQGKLLENGSPVNGPKDFTFSIDVDGNIWTEDHLGVSVSDGLYSVVLGSITPLPDDLFKSVDSRSMDISIGGTPISPIDVFAPSTSYYFSHNDGAVSRPAILAELSGNVTGWAAIEGVSTVEGNAYGVYGFAGTTVDGESAGVYGYGQGVGKTNMGVFGIGRGLGNGDDFNAPGGGSYNNGVVGWASNNTFGNSGVFGLAHGTKGVDNLGVVGWSEVMNGSENKGVLGWAKGDGINKGVVGMATGGTENWAGWFDGDVMISGSLVSSGANPLQVNNGAGDLRAEMGLFNDGGSIKAYGSGGLNAAILGTRASNDAQGFLGLYNTAGVAGINMKVEGGPGTEYGSLLTMGPNTPNIQLLGKNWDDPDLPAIYLFGQHTNGSTWYKTNVLLEVHSDGTNNWGKLTLENGIEGASPQEPTVQLDGFDGSLTLRSPDGSQEFRIDPSGLGASSTSFPNLEIETGFTDPGTPGITMGVTQDTGGNDPTGYSGWIGVNGKNGPNITLSANSFENHDLPSFNMAGSIVHPTEGWTYSSLDMWVERDNGTGEEAAKFHMMGNEGISNIEMGGKLWEPGGGGLPYMAMRGIQGPDLVWMEAVDDGAGNEMGSINFMSTDGASFGINAYGLIGQMNDIDIANFASIGDASDNAVQMDSQSLNMIKGGDGSDNGWNVVSLNASDNGTNFWGSLNLNADNDIPNIEMGAKEWEGPSGYARPYMVMRGSTQVDDGAGNFYYPDMVWMEVQDDGVGNEAGAINFRSTDGSEFGINAYGFTGLASYFRAQDGIAVAETTNPFNNAIEMFESGDAGYMNVNNSSNVNSISLDGSDGSISATGNVGSATSTLSVGDSRFVHLGANADFDTQLPYLFMSGDDNNGGNTEVIIRLFDDGAGDYGHIQLQDPSNTASITLNGKDGSASFVNGMVGAGPDAEGDGEFNLSSTSASAIRMYGKLDDIGGSRSHIALDGENTEHVWLWGNGGINVGDAGSEISIGVDNLNVFFDNGGGMASYATLSASSGGIGGAVFGSIYLTDDLGNSARVSGEGNIDATGTISGTILVSSDGTVQASDRRLKTNITDLQGSLDNTLKLRGVSYNWIDKKKDPNNQIGVIAQEVEEVYPEFVKTMDNGYKAVNYAQMTAVLIEAVKELNAKIEALESENTELKASLGKVESNDEQLKAMQSQIKSLQLMFEKLTEPGVQNVQVTGGQE